MVVAKHRATYADLVAAPETMVAEIVDGQLYTTPRPATPHARAEVAIHRAVAPFDEAPSAAGTPGGWWILIEPELHFDDDVLVPDLAGWRRERMPTIPNAPAISIPPDWVCEVVSPYTGYLDRGRKMPIYAREGVAHIWLVDPLNRTLEVCWLEQGRWVVIDGAGDADRVHVAPFEALEIDLARWWLTPPAASTA